MSANDKKEDSSDTSKLKIELKEARDECDKLKNQLEKTMADLDRARNCSICYEREKKIMFKPCRHILTCENCACLVYVCPCCRDYIKKRVLVNIA